MKKKIIIFISVLAIILVGVTLVIAVPNSIGKKITDEIKARGYIEYSSDEAKVLALEKCTQCHDTERILKYCHRCGPHLWQYFKILSVSWHCVHFSSANTFASSDEYSIYPLAFISSVIFLPILFGTAITRVTPTRIIANTLIKIIIFFFIAYSPFPDLSYYNK